VGIGTPWKAALLLAVGAAGGAAAVAVASVPDGNGVVHACVELSSGSTQPIQGPNVRVIDGTQTCSTGVPPSGGTPPESAVQWNVTGPQGVPGTPGSPGTPGKSATVVGGNTLTIGGGQVITVGNAPTLTVISPAVGNRSIATLSFTGGIKTDILSYSLAAKTGSSGGSGGSGGASGKVAVHDIQITKPTDKSSPKLFLACVNGQHFKQGTLVVRKAGGTQLTYTLSDVLIASAQSTGHGGKLVDSLTLNYAKLTIQTAKAHA
jgi:type VI secretion system secreted protein Hcp